MKTTCQKSNSRLVMQKPLYFIGITLLLLSGCTGLKTLNKGEKLYSGAEIHYKGKGKKSLKGKVEAELEEVIEKPVPNEKLLVSRPKLWLYRIAGTPKKEKGFKYWMKNKLGSPPVLSTEADPERASLLLENRLANNGYFAAKVDYELLQHPKTMGVRYWAELQNPYYLDSIYFPEGDTPLIQAIQEQKKESSLEPGSMYNLTGLKYERARIEAALKEQGYYFFHQEYLLFKVDSTVGDKRMHVYLDLKEEIPEKAKHPYTIRNIYVYLDQNRNSLPEGQDTLKIDQYYFFEGRRKVKPKALIHNILLSPGETYSGLAFQRTLKRLNALDIYKFVNVSFEETGSGAQLDMHIELLLNPKRSLQMEFNYVTKSNNYTGPFVSITQSNRNLFSGMENLSLRLRSGFETQWGQEQNNQTSYELGLEGEIRFPKAFLPLVLGEQRSRRYLAQSRLKAGVTLLNRPRYFKTASFDVSFGYRWWTTERNSFSFDPVAVNYIRLLEAHEGLDSLLQVNKQLEDQVGNQMILGNRFVFTYNTPFTPKDLTYFYWNVDIEMAGNLMYLGDKIFGGRTASEGGPRNALGVPYVQYAKVSNEFRFYKRLSKNSLWVNRLFVGVGYPYGNSELIPYAKQYFVGGANSIRAFVARQVGPGSFLAQNLQENQVFLDQTGDIRLELNTEWRFPVFSYLKGALFVDAGNVWLVRKDELRKGEGVFSMDRFYKELAVGAGFGLRLDVEFFVLRLDWAFPLMIPYLPEGERWVGGEVNPLKKEWRQKNLLFNLAIGYPF
ncbi:BamA/TamA family outer membrane protein [Rapidithrix thailandica]|uniref:BamA/TamA family outer membrane protein n=1 Tax=Rapidithrix thailandica TaxID=413964 RepID=A0AAW9RZ03_9BACT